MPTPPAALVVYASKRCRVSPGVRRAFVAVALASAWGCRGPEWVAGTSLIARPDRVAAALGEAPGAVTFDLVAQYPRRLLQDLRPRYVLSAHWEDFFSAWTGRLRAVPIALDQAGITRFVSQVDDALGPGSAADGPIPLPGDPCRTPGACGPRSARWALPVRGETFWFKTGSR